MYIFNENNPESPLVGDFDGLYSDINDPWDQSATNESSKMYSFYKSSRQHLANFLSSHQFSTPTRVLEVGCGHGYVLPYIQRSLPYAVVTGVDVSSSAIGLAKNKNPAFDYVCANIIKQPITPGANLIILSNLLWYIIDEVQSVCHNIAKTIDNSSSSTILIYNAFFQEPAKYYTNYSNSPQRVLNLFLKSFPCYIHIKSRLIDLSADSSLCYDSVIIALTLEKR